MTCLSWINRRIALESTNTQCHNNNFRKVLARLDFFFQLVLRLSFGDFKQKRS